ncbi:Predicted arabinose efflux permease, MFS family [Jeotgalicoccus aerolatus]|uniref:Predicted arabinose efflux permease, MFS family n=1 Tax=Jeotgalicoccus aerolatus TaxID=709510 RepID=A0A1G9C7J8_9STAP|nr:MULTISPECIES: MFS transporter [Bacillales]SDK47648.1 Predicted arabinose efflux permease, MFS family [Jeotgalicoccus aerolatus]
MFTFIPLGDIYEKKKLILSLLFAVGLALIFLATAQNLYSVYIASFMVGFTTVSPQIIVPFAAELASPYQRGKVIGSVMSGLLIGILLAIAVAGFIGELFSWRVMFGFASLLMFLLTYVLYRYLPTLKPKVKLSYLELLRSIKKLIVQERTLREAALISALMFGSFSAFWTTLTFFLEGPHYQYGSSMVGVFSLIGVVGVVTTSVVGKLSDRFSSQMIVGLMTVIVLLSYVLFGLFGTWHLGLIIGIVLLDLGYQGTHISNQTRIYSLSAEAKGRLNTVYMVSSFIGGALGSAVGVAAWERWGWLGICVIGGSMATVAFLVWLWHYLLKQKRTR